MCSLFLAIYLYACSVLFLRFFHLLDTVDCQSILPPVYYLLLSICVFISTLHIFNLHILSYLLLLLCNQFCYLYLLFLIFVSLLFWLIILFLLQSGLPSLSRHLLFYLKCSCFSFPFRYLFLLSCYQFLSTCPFLRYLCFISATLVFFYYSCRPGLL